MNAELKKLFGHMKKTHAQLTVFLTDHAWVGNTRNYAQRQSKELKKLFSSDIKKIRQFLEKEKKALHTLKTALPKKVKKMGHFIGNQKEEVTLLLKNINKKNAQPRRKSPKKTASRVKSKKSTSKTTPKSTQGQQP